MTMYEVVRPFDADGRQLRRGDLVDATDWKNTVRLVAQRYIKPVETASASTGQTAQRTRKTAKPRAEA